jgi:hypothetical protein
VGQRWQRKPAAAGAGGVRVEVALQLWLVPTGADLDSATLHQPALVAIAIQSPARMAHPSACTA